MDLVQLAAGAVGIPDGAAPSDWVHAESDATHAVGDVCTFALEAEVDNRGFVREGGVVRLVEKVLRANLEQWKKDRAETSDARVTPVKFNPAGDRHRPWSSVAGTVSDSVVDHWPVKGLRTAPWVARFMARHNTL